MTGINVDYINPFLMAATGVIKDICQIEMKIGKPYVKETAFADDSVIIMIGITGEMRGQVMIVLSYTVVIQPAYDPPEDEIITEEGMEELTPDNTYVQKEGDKYYMIYKNDKDEISKEDAEEMKMSGFEVKENEEK